MRWAGWLLVATLVCGCGRAYYREDADQETYSAIAERFRDPRWWLPRTNIDTPPASRLHDPSDPDYPPMPPDDPAAHLYMRQAYRYRGSKHYYKDGELAWIEDPAWREYLELDKDNQLVLTSDKSVELALLNSRDYQTQLENLYLVALRLTLERFEFDVQWFARNSTFYDHAGTSSVPTESNTLRNDTNVGFSKALAAGGQLLVDFANAYVFEYTGPDTYTVSSNVAMNFTQPLLRQAGRRVRLEGLIQSERDVLYAVRDFARYRKDFTFDLTTSGGYLGLLLQVQSIRNLESNLRSREQNLRLNESLFDNGTVSTVQVDESFQSFQAARLSLLRAQTDLENSIDGFLIQLGLPPTFKVKLDDSLLDPFQLSDPSLTQLQDALEKLQREFREPVEAPPAAKLIDGLKRLQQLNRELGTFVGQVEDELARWSELPPQAEQDEQEKGREKRARESLRRQLQALRDESNELGQGLPQAAARVTENTRPNDWAKLKRLIRQQAELTAQVFVIQNQVRVYLIRLQVVQLQESEAIAFALEERLDLMNRRALVVDAWRKVAVAANNLLADVNVVVDANLGSAADATRPFDLSALNSRYRVGLRIDGPLNRQSEQNVYRASLIEYQRARRAFMELEDSIKQSLRRDLRSLETERLNFEIARQSFVTAARQVESARAQLIVDPRIAETTGTTNVLNALDTLLASKNTLIATWVSYQTLRQQLLLNLEALQLDDRGLYRDDQPINAEFLRTRSRGYGVGESGCDGPAEPAQR